MKSAPLRVAAKRRGASRRKGFSRDPKGSASHSKSGQGGHMVLASHVIIGMYGFWLPNDERGSWSDFVGSWEVLRFGQGATGRGGQ